MEVLTEKDYRKVCKENNLAPVSTFRGLRHNGSYIRYCVRCLSCNDQFYTDFSNGKPRVCPHCKHHEFRSQRERQIVVWLKEKKIDVVISDRTVLAGQEIDIYLPDYSVGIEINGIAFHFTDCNKTIITPPKSKDYHYNKTRLAMMRGVALYHLWDYQSLECCKSIIVSAINKEPLLTNSTDINPYLIDQAVLKPMYYVTETYKHYTKGLYAQKPVNWETIPVMVYEFYPSGFILNKVK